MKHKTEQRALAALQAILVMVVVGSLLFFLIAGGKEDRREKDGRAMAYGDTFPTARSGKAVSDKNDTAPVTSPESIPFDPNTADSLTLIRVGLSPFQVRNILRYRQKGGAYHRPEDMKRLYGLTIGQWEHLAPLIRIEKKYQYLSDREDVYAPHHERRGGASWGRGEGTPEKEEEKERDTARHRVEYPLHTDSGSYSPVSRNAHAPTQQRVVKLRPGQRIDLNTADTTALKTIPGIGSYFAMRIAEYRKRLGGFVSLDQLNDHDLNFLPVGIEAYLTLHPIPVRQLRINHLSVRELNQHPYLSYAQAREICETVRTHGPLHSWQELLFLSEFSERDRERLEPYVSFE